MTTADATYPDVDGVVDLLDQLDERSRKGDRLTIQTVQDIAGTRATGPLLLVPGLAAFSPLSGIPTFATIIGSLVAIICLQIVLGKHHIWLPRRLRKAGLEPDRGLRATRYIRPFAAFIDRWSGRRLAWLTRGIGKRLAAAACLIVALCMPFLELVPMSATIAGLVIALFGLALTARDGVLMAATLSLVVAGAVGLSYLFL